MSSRGFALKQFIILFALGFTAFGILAAVLLVKSPSTMQTSALNCSQKPKLVLESTNKYETMTIYNLKLINNCNSANEFILNVSKLPETPAKYENWTWKFQDGDWNTSYTTEKLSGTSDISLTIQNPTDLSGIPERIQPGIYRFFSVETALANSPSSADVLELIYTAK
jgi:uncharacterized protein (UPF0333 family)